MVFKDYYKILGFDTNRVTADEIKNAYREQAKKFHPDINGAGSETEEIFKDVNEAYKTLSNTKSRRKYDFSWHRYVGRKKNKTQKEEKKSLKEVFLNIFFGSIPKKKKKEVLTPKYGEDIVTQINVTLEEAFFGANKKLTLRNIKGKEVSFGIKIPAGVQEKDKVRVIGKGKSGQNGGKNGDLLVYIHIKENKKIKLIGQDLIYEMPLNTWEAALGTTKNITVFREKLKVIIPSLISSGDRLVINEKGYKKMDGTRGKLIIVAKLILPKKMSDEEKELYKKLKELNSN